MIESNKYDNFGGPQMYSLGFIASGIKYKQNISPLLIRIRDIHMKAFFLFQ